MSSDAETPSASLPLHFLSSRCCAAHECIWRRVGTFFFVNPALYLIAARLHHLLSALCVSHLSVSTPPVWFPLISTEMCFVFGPWCLFPAVKVSALPPQLWLQHFLFSRSFFPSVIWFLFFFFCRSEGAQMAWFFFLDNNGVYLSVMVVCWNIIIKNYFKQASGSYWWCRLVRLQNLAVLLILSSIVLCPVGGADETTWGH